MFRKLFRLMTLGLIGKSTKNRLRTEQIKTLKAERRATTR